MSGPKGNSNAAKPVDEKTGFPVTVRGTEVERRAWRKAAAGDKFNAWARKALNKSAKIS